MDDQIVRLTWDGKLVTAPAGTNKCAQTVGRPHWSDLTHRLAYADNPGPMVQLLTGCGHRAHRFVLETEGKQVDCPNCLANGELAADLEEGLAQARAGDTVPAETIADDLQRRREAGEDPRG